MDTEDIVLKRGGSDSCHMSPIKPWIVSRR